MIVKYNNFLFEQENWEEDPYGEDNYPDRSKMKEEITRLFLEEFPEDREKDRKLWQVHEFIMKMKKKIRCSKLRNS